MGNVVLSEGCSSNMGRSISSVRMLQQLLFAHLLLVVFQMPFRAMVLDTTFVRDVMLIAAIILWGLIILSPKNSSLTIRLTLLDRLFVFYLLCGVTISVIALVNGVDPLQAITQFRNNFLPAFLYFVAKKAFSSNEGRVRLVNMFLFLSLVIIIDVILEFLLFQTGMSKYLIPWYKYTFKVSYRFIGNETNAIGYILPENSPVLGLLGWGHATAAALMVLFAFSHPYYSEKHLKAVHKLGLYIDARWVKLFRNLLIVSAGLSIIILNVTMHIVSLLVVLLLLPILNNPKLLLRNIMIFCIGIGALLLVAFDFLGYFSRIGINFYETEFSLTSLGAIVDSFYIIPYIVGLPIEQILFGTGNVINNSIDFIYGAELRLLFFAMTYGQIWLFLYLSIYGVGVMTALKIAKNHKIYPMMRRFAIGIIGLLVVCLMDMGHYARAMYFPIIDIWAVGLGALSALSVEKTKH